MSCGAGSAGPPAAADCAQVERALGAEVHGVEGALQPAVEILLNTSLIAELIKSGEFVQIKEAMEQSLAPESMSFEQSLYSLIQADQITREDALAAADSQNNLLWFINNAGKPMSQTEKKRERSSDASFSEFTLNI